MRGFSVFQVVGYKQSGKTTLINHIVSIFTDEHKVRFGTLKNHGHGGEPELVQSTDSYQHLQSGSVISGVQGENRLHLKVASTANHSLKDLINIYAHFPIDLLLIEGYKNASYPKIVLIRDDDDLHLLDQLTNIVAVGGWTKPTLKKYKYPTFSLQNVKEHTMLFKRLLSINKS